MCVYIYDGVSVPLAILSTVLSLVYIHILSGHFKDLRLNVNVLTPCSGRY